MKSAASGSAVVGIDRRHGSRRPRPGRRQAGFHAGAAGARGCLGRRRRHPGAIDTLRLDGTLTAGETLRAVALLELGAERQWPQAVTNFAQGVDGGGFTLGGVLPPAGADALRQFCLERAGVAAEGGLAAPGAAAPAAQVKRDYRTRFGRALGPPAVRRVGDRLRRDPLEQGSPQQAGAATLWCHFSPAPEPRGFGR